MTTELIKGTLAYKLAEQRGELPMKRFTVDILTNPPMFEIAAGISKVERKTVIIEGYSLRDAKLRASIQ
jgi:hypothetical protein